MSASQEEAAAVLAEGAAALADLFGRLSPEAAEARGTIGGGSWSACDLAGHVETWEEVALRSIEDVRAGRPPGIDEVVTDLASMHRFNAEEVGRKAHRSWDEALAAFRLTNAALIATILAMPEEAWGTGPEHTGKGPYEGRTLGETVGSVTGSGPEAPFRHAWAHLDDLRAYVDALGA